MCIVCADMSGQFRRAEFLPEDLSIDRGLSASARRNGDGSLAYLDVDGRGGTAPNGKASLLPGDAGAQITRLNQSWATGLGQAATVTYAYRSNAPGTMPTDTAGFTRFSEAQIQATELMLLAWSDVARITFQRDGAGTTGEGAYSDTAAMLFGNYSSGQGGAAAFAYLPGTPPQTSAAANNGNVWVNSSLSYNSAPTYLGYGYQVLLHEIGHAIGLSHPADYNAGPNVSITYSAHAIYYEDSRQYSVMSYFSERNTGGDFNFRYSSAPLLDDIAAAQRLYGANMTTRTGDTVYGFNSNAGRIWYDATQGGGAQAVIFAVWDAGGTDTLDFSGYTHASLNYNVNEPTAGALIDLRQGHFSNVGGLVGNVSIAMGAVIENAIGGNGVETIIGNSADNRLNGRGGNDVIEGGAGSDTAVFSGNQASYTITPGTEIVDGVAYRILTVTGPDGTDVLRNIEFLAFADATIPAPTAAAGILLEGDVTADTITGTTFADWIYGADGSDSINGGDGNDRINGGRGNDTLNGGNGVDTLDYAGSTAGVTVNLGTGTATGGAGTDAISNFENVTGTAYADTLTGDGGANVLNGAGGLDTLNGQGGNDTLIAGAGIFVGADDVIKPGSTSNFTLGTAVNIDANFDMVDDPGVVNATTVPHAVIRASSSGGGQEYYAFTVTAGAACVFDIASASFDTTLRIFDAAGNQLAVNDDDSGSTNSLINHTFASGGTYYVVVGQYSSGSGASVVSAPPPSGGEYVLNVSIPNHAFVEATSVGSTLNGGDGDDLLYGGVSDDDINGGIGSDTAVFAGNRSAWTITDNGGGSFTLTNGTQTDTLTGVEFAQFADQTVNLLGDDSIQGTEGADVLVGTVNPDVMRGLGGDDTLSGLAGADELDGGLGTDTADYSASNSGVIVRLFAGTGLGGHAEGDTLISIERVIGSIYGDSLIGSDSLSGDELEGGDGHDFLDGRLGNDVLEGGLGNDTLYGQAGLDSLFGGVGNDVLRGGAGADIIDGGDGFDTADYGNGGSGVTVRLWNGTGAGADAAGDTYFSIERVVGSAFGDSLIGSDTAAGDTLEGGGGADYLSGLGGSDILDGGLGIDTLLGGLGNDLLRGGAGGDMIDGGAGTDTADYSTSGSGVTIRLWNGVHEGGDALGDTLISIERVIGSIYGDTLVGSDTVAGDTLEGGAGNDVLDGRDGADVLDGGAGTDTLSGGAGNDVLRGGAGADAMDGGDGLDAVDYSTATSGVTVRLFNGTGAGGDAAGDTFVSIERVIGSVYGDSLIGADVGLGDTLEGGAGNDYLSGLAGSDVLDGGQGTDTLLGGSGDDLLRGGAGADTLDGGSGIDTADYSTSTGGVTIRLYNGVHAGADAAGDTLTSIERVVGSIYGDSLIGSDTAAGDVLEGGAGNDYLAGRDGTDVLRAGTGNDSLFGGAGADTFAFRAGDTGSKTIGDFSLTGDDVIEFATNLFVDFADVMSSTTDDGLGNTVISRAGVSITLTGVLKAQLTSGDFQFVAPAPLLPQDKASPLTLPGLLTDDPLILPHDFGSGQLGSWATGAGDAQVLPAGLDAKGLIDEMPVICPPGDLAVADPGSLARPVLDLAELGLSDLGGRDPHRFLVNNQQVDWIV